MLLEYQFPIRFQFQQLFLKTLRGTAYVQLTQFQNPIHKNNFNIYHTQRIFNFPQKLARNQYICGESQNASPLCAISPSLSFLKMLRTTAQRELIYFHDTIQKSDFNTYYATAIFNLPEKLLATNICMFLERFSPLAIAEIFERHCCLSMFN